MKKLIVVAALITLCALLEVPQDYEWTPDFRNALRTEHSANRPVSTGPEEITGIREAGVAL